MRRLALLTLLAVLSPGCGPLGSTDDGSGGPTSGTGGGQGGCGTDADTWASFGAAFFAGSCGSCHTFTHAEVQSSRRTIAIALTAGSMPMGGGLDDTARSRALAYLSCGAP